MRVQHLVRQSGRHREGENGGRLRAASRGMRRRSGREGEASCIASDGNKSVYCSPFSLELLCCFYVYLATIELFYRGSVRAAGVRRPIWLFDRALSLTLQSAITLNLACRIRPQFKTVPLNPRQCTRHGEPCIRSAINDGSRDGAGAAPTPDGGRCGRIVPREHMTCAQTSAAALAQRRHPHSNNWPRPPAPTYSAQKNGLVDMLRCSYID